MSHILTHTPARRALTIAVTSGKGGVGKTSVVLNLAVALARLGKRVAVLDADFSLGNVDVLLGLAPERHLGHLLSGEATLDEILMEGPSGVRIVPASSGLRELTLLTPTQWQRLSRAMELLSRDVDFLVVDTAPGIGDSVIDLASATDRTIVVTSLDPTAVVDAYATIKVLSGVDSEKPIGILVNAVEDEQDARAVFAQLSVAAERFLQRSLTYDGFIPADRAVRDAVMSQTTVVEQLPHAPSSRCFRALATRLSGQAAHAGPGLRVIHTRSATGIEGPRWA